MSQNTAFKSFFHVDHILIYTFQYRRQCEVTECSEQKLGNEIRKGVSGKVSVFFKKRILITRGRRRDVKCQKSCPLISMVMTFFTFLHAPNFLNVDYLNNQRNTQYILF